MVPNFRHRVTAPRLFPWRFLLPLALMMPSRKATYTWMQTLQRTCWCPHERCDGWWRRQRRRRRRPCKRQCFCWQCSRNPQHFVHSLACSRPGWCFWYCRLFPPPLPPSPYLLSIFFCCWGPGSPQIAKSIHYHNHHLPLLVAVL